MIKDLEKLYASIQTPDGQSHPDKARLFPVLAEKSKEGRALSIFLACFANVPDFGKRLLHSLEGVKVLAYSKIDTFAEVTFESAPRSSRSGNLRPDGLIVVKNRRDQFWTSLIEAKVGGNRLDANQLADYVDLADEHGIDAVVTVSNEFAAVPHHHPVYVPKKGKRKPKARVYHWSWASIRTHAELMLHNQEFESPADQLLIQELTRFLAHQSSGVKSFEQMVGDWMGLLTTIKNTAAGEELDERSKQVIGAVASWHQETRDLALQLSRLVKDHIVIKLSRDAKNNAQKRIEEDSKKLAANTTLEVEFDIQNAAAPLRVVADLRIRLVTVGMTLQPNGKKSTMKGQVGWLQRQLNNSNPKDMTIHAYWGKSKRKSTHGDLKEVFENWERLVPDTTKTLPTQFEIRYTRQMHSMGAKQFITHLEEAVPFFYEEVGQKLKKWQPPPPRVIKDQNKKAKDQQETGQESTANGNQTSEAVT